MADKKDPKNGGGAAGSGGTEGFTAITTQEDLDRIITSRIARERDKYSDYDEYKAAAEKLKEIEEAGKSEADKLKAANAELDAKLKAYEAKEKAAALAAEVSKETGIPAGALRGSTRDELVAHAETLKELYGTGNKKKPAPVVKGVGEQTEGTQGASTAQQFADALDGLI
jgi:hypothetical protein